MGARANYVSSALLQSQSRIIMALCTIIFHGILAGHFLLAGNAGGLQQLSMLRRLVLQMSHDTRLESIS